MFFSVILVFAVVYAIACLVYIFIQTTFNRPVDWRMFTLEKLAYTFLLFFFIGFYFLVRTDFKTEEEHVQHGLVTGSVVDVQYISGGITDVGDDSFYKVFITSELGDREEVWCGSTRDVKSLYIGKELRLDTTQLHYLSTLKKPTYTKR